MVPVLAGLLIGIAFLLIFALVLSVSLSNGKFEELEVKMLKRIGDCDCPGYTVRVDESGWVSFEGYDYLANPGKHNSVLSSEKVRELVDAIEKASFFELNDQYGEYSDGTPRTTISITLNSKSKTVTNYNGDNEHEIYELEKTIDEMLGTRVWVIGR